MPASIVKMLETIARIPHVDMLTRMRAAELLGKDPLGFLFTR